MQNNVSAQNSLFLYQCLFSALLQHYREGVHMDWVPGRPIPFILKTEERRQNPPALMTRHDVIARNRWGCKQAPGEKEARSSAA